MGMIFGKETVAEPSYKILLKSLPTVTKTPYEIRQYNDRYAAQTIYPMGSSTNVPFRKLANYIGVFGTPNNIGNQPIAMTAPVSMSTVSSSSSSNKEQQQPGQGQPVSIAMTAPVSMKAVTTGSTNEMQQVMTFYLPSMYNEHPESIPTPTPDSDVTITCIPGAIGAVHRFSGTMDTKTARIRAIQLKQQLTTDGITFPDNTNDNNQNNENSENDLDTVPLDFYEAWGYNPPFTIPAFRRNEIWIEITKEQFDQLLEKHQQQQQEKEQSSSSSSETK